MKDNGGPAFPVQDLSKWQCPGMSLRDWFAGQALAKLTVKWDPIEGEPFFDLIAGVCYDVADAMLAKRGEDWGKE